MASDEDTRPAPPPVLGIDPAGGPDRTAWSVVTHRILPPTITIDDLGTDPPFEMPGSAAQRRVLMNGLYTAPVYAARGVSHDPYPGLSTALQRWCDAALREHAGPVAVHASWSNLSGYSGTGWTIESGNDEVWSWDAWVPALVILASVEDRVVGERRCPLCRGRRSWTYWRRFSFSEREAIVDNCPRCGVAGSVDIRLADLVFAAAQGWPWAREHGSVIADRLQAEGDPWGHWLAALLEPRQWGGWFAYPKRAEHAAELAERLDRLTERRRQSGGSATFSVAKARPAAGKSLALLFSPLAQASAAMAATQRAIEQHMAATGRDWASAQVEITGEDPRMTAVTRGDTTTLTFHDDQPHTVRMHPIVTMAEVPDEGEAPVVPPIGRNLERRLNRGRRGRG